MKAQDGTMLMNTEDNISRLAEYYRDLLNKASQHIDGRDEPLTECSLHEVTREEVERQLNKMKNGKSCGPGGIPRHSNTVVIGVCVNSPKSTMQSCKAARCHTNGERASSHLSIKTR